MKKTIGIITFHRTSNFGSCLQSFGLYRKIMDLGYTCEIIDYRCPAIERRENLKPVFSIFKPRDIYRHFFIQPIYEKKARQLENFVKKEMEISMPVFPENKSSVNNKYCKVLVGSDIVWGRDITENDYTYFLDFITGKSKKYAFASSVGDCDIREDETRLKSLLNDFSQIAVRENEAAEWVKSISGVESKLVCDPTMLLTTEEWEHYVPTKIIPSGYVFVYFNSDNGKCLEDAKKYANQRNLRVTYVNYGRPIKGVNSVKPTSLEEFLSLMRYADAIFTASYHGMLFSIYFNKEFLFYTRSHKSRVLSLARKLGVLDHCGDKWNNNLYQKINYTDVNAKIEEFRNYSIDILKGMLSE